jgi:hypothetical protein
MGRCDTRDIRRIAHARHGHGKVEKVKELMTDQAILAIFPIVSLSILVGVAAAYFLYKERRAGRQQDSNRNR